MQDHGVLLILSKHAITHPEQKINPPDRGIQRPAGIDDPETLKQVIVLIICCLAKAITKSADPTNGGIPFV